MMQLYPEIYSCIGCNACTKACPQGLNVMQYIAYAQRGEFKKCAEESFDCVMCGICSARCPAGISHPQVALLARRLNGKYIAPEAKHLTERVKAIEEGEFKKCAEESFDCVMCGICSSRCPAGISHPQVALLARRLNGKYIAPEAKHLTERVKAIEEGEFNALIEDIMQKPLDEIKELYNHRDIEK